MAIEVALVLVSLIVILAGAELFTNAVEWLGAHLGLSHGAIGSVLAAVGTALPETMIPIVAIVAGGSSDSHDVGIGAILGAPFLLSTAAFAVTGLGVLSFRGRRRSGTDMRIDPSILVGVAEPPHVITTHHDDGERGGCGSRAHRQNDPAIAMPS